MSLPVGSPVLTVIIGCIMDLLGVCNCLQMRCNVNHILSCSYSVSISMRNRLYADGHVDQWCGSKYPSTVQLLLNTTKLQ